MPIVTFHLTQGMYSTEQGQALLAHSCVVYAGILKAPMERVRAMIIDTNPELTMVAGELAAQNNLHAPFFKFIVLDGRPLEERQSLLTGFTDLIERELSVERKLIRGQCIRVTPEEWGIGGIPASQLRKAEVDKRAET